MTSCKTCHSSPFCFSINQITTVKYYSCTVPWIIPTLNVAGHGCSAVSFYYIIFYILDNILWLCPMQIWELTWICQIMYVSTCMHEIVKFTFENKCINNQLYCGEGCELFIIFNSCFSFNRWCLVWWNDYFSLAFMQHTIKANYNKQEVLAM